MDYDRKIPEEGIKIIDDYMVVSMKTDIAEEDVAGLQERILISAKEKRIKYIVIDMSDVHILEVDAFNILAGTGGMLEAMGSQAVFTGFRAGVASALIDFEVDPGKILTSLNIDEGISLLRSRVKRS